MRTRTREKGDEIRGKSKDKYRTTKEKSWTEEEDEKKPQRQREINAMRDKNKKATKIKWRFFPHHQYQ